MKKLQKRQLTSTLPNSAGAPAVGPPACKSRCDCRPPACTHIHTRAHTCTHVYTHTMYMHTPPGHGKPTLAPVLLPPGGWAAQPLVLCLLWPQVINWTTQVLAISCPSLFSAALSTTSLVSTPQKRSPVSFPQRRAFNLLLLNGTWQTLEKEFAESRTVLSLLQIFILF